MSIIIKTIFLVVVAEMGDKTQLLAMAMASKYKASQVLLGVFLATILNHGVAVVIGSYLNSLIPISTIKIAAAAAFIIFGLWTLRGDKLDDEENKNTRLGPVAAVAIAFFIAEMGDKTQLMTITLSAQVNNAVLILVGSTIGMMISDGIGILGGAWMYKHIPETYIKWAAGIVFILFGTITLYDFTPIWAMNPLYITAYFIILGSLIYVFGVKFSNRSQSNACSMPASHKKIARRKIR